MKAINSKSKNFSKSKNKHKESHIKAYHKLLGKKKMRNLKSIQRKKIHYIQRAKIIMITSFSSKLCKPENNGVLSLEGKTNGNVESMLRENIFQKQSKIKTFLTKADRLHSHHI